MVHMEKKPEKKSEMHRAETCTCFCASHAYAMQASGRTTAAGFVLSRRIYGGVLVVTHRHRWREGENRYCTSGE